ncbi:hypothetical protein [Ruminococcus albus]|uniref:Cellulose binding domain-containing protein n=1 Tax=Ruminococcus albus TaxID=1264 RepID=A0A1H7N0Y4_RUMAL|nr:hypothetical protein [Ruminococcus albus]SEL17222.1 hypothetical protein SAMN05216469_11370 [Ruminococcus albus]
MKNNKKIISGLTALALACGLALPASASLNTGDSRAYRGTGYLAKYEVLSVKDGYTTVKISLKNTSKKTINNWAVGFEHEGRIQSVKNGRLFDTNNWYNSGYPCGYNVIRNSSTNGTVAPNEYVSFSFTMTDENGYNELPERLKVYSDVDKSNTVDGLNKAAKECFAAVDVVFRDYEYEGLSLEDCFKNGEFAKANSKDGMKTGFNYKYTAKGDNEVNIEASKYARGNISVYVGKTKINGEDSAFVQVRDNKTGKVGQWPRPSDGTVTWGTFDPDSPIYTNYSVEDLNSAAKDAYDDVAEYIADLETMGLDYKGCFENGGFPNAHTQDGLKIDYNSSFTEGDKAINDWLKFMYDGMIVYVGKTGIDAYGQPEFFVQAKDPKTGKIGQYPHPTQGEATWGTFDENTPEAVKTCTSRELDEEAKIAYNAVAEYFADLETQGYDVLECYNNGYFKYSSTKEGLKMGTASLTDGDKAVVSELYSYGSYSDVTIYVGINSVDEYGDPYFFVQVKDNKTGNIGQYPTTDHRNLEWGTYSNAVPRLVHDQKHLNGDAKTVYNAVSEYFADLETEGYDLMECYNNGCFAKASTIEGLKIGQETSLTDGDKAIYDEMKWNIRIYEGLTVYVGVDLDSKNEYGDYAFFVQVKDATGRVGQYPDPTRDSATWGTLHAKEPEQSEKVTLSLYAEPGSSAKVHSIQLEAGSTIPESTIASWINLGESNTTAWIPCHGYYIRTVFVAIVDEDGERIEEYLDKPVLANSNFYILTQSEIKEEPNQSERVTVSLYDEPGSSSKVTSIQLKAGSTIPESTIASWIKIGKLKTTNWIPHNGYSERTVFSSIRSDTGETIEEYIDKPILTDCHFYILTQPETRVEP